MWRRIGPIAASVVLTLGISAVSYGAEPSLSPAAAGPPGVTGPGLESLTITPGVVEVVAGAAVRMPGLGFGPATRILAIVGNGTEAPVDANVAWAASGPDGALAWVGELGTSRSSVNGNLLSGSVPRPIPPGGFGLQLGGDDALPEDVAVTFAVRSEAADEPSPDEPAVSVTSASVVDGHLVGDLRNASEDPVERGVAVVAFCLHPSGEPTAGTGVFLDVDDPIEPGGTAAFDIDLAGADCTRFVLGALGDS